jgi:hypothetical protein
MEFNLNEEFVEKNGLNEDQVNAIKTHIESDFVPTIKKEYDGVANTNAENILSGAANKVAEITGIQREQGQKIADYISFAGEKYFEGTKAELDRKKLDLDDKIKNAGTDETLKSELQSARDLLDGYKQKEAQYDDLIKGGYKDKYENLYEETTSLKKTNAFNSVKPTFDKSVNEYEARAKWNEFVNGIQSTHKIEFDENNEAIAVDKENQYKVTKLSELVNDNKSIQDLVKGRQQFGLEHQKKMQNIDDIPFALPENPNSKDIQTAITDYLTREK